MQSIALIGMQTLSGILILTQNVTSQLGSHALELATINLKFFIFCQH